MSVKGIGIRIENFISKDNRPGWCTSSSTELRSELTDYSKKKPFLVRHWSNLSKILISIFLVSLWCVLFLSLHNEIPWIALYMTFVATLVSFFEMISFLNSIFCTAERKQTCMHLVWDFLIHITTWKKLVIYLLLTIPAFIKIRECPMALVCGILVDLIGVINFIHLFREKNEKIPIRYRQLGGF